MSAGLASKGSIPACAGEPVVHGAGLRPREVYPRVCRGTAARLHGTHRSAGLSPRVQGNLPSLGYFGKQPWSIPACAGEPSLSLASLAASEVYPRVCRGTVTTMPERQSGGGLSPRVQGNHPPGENLTMGERSIPACAGEPIPPLSQRSSGGVYPRVCRGTAFLTHAIGWV